MKIVVSGGWSYGNIGDEAIAASTIYLCEKYLGHEIIYTSFDPRDFERRHSKNNVIPSVHKMFSENINEFSDYSDIKQIMKNDIFKEYCGLFDKDTIFIMSGGGYFNESWNNQFWARILEINIAYNMGAKVVIIGQSIGPVISEIGKSALSDALKKCDFISVRDSLTKEYLEQFVEGIDINVYPDVAVIISDVIHHGMRDNTKTIVNIMPANYIRYSNFDTNKKGSYIVKRIPNRLSLKRYKYIIAYRSLLNYLLKNKNENLMFQFVLSTNWKWDRKFVDLIKRGLPKDKFIIYENLSHEKMCNLLSEGRITISTKMHPVIISTSYSVPAVAISYNYKIDGFMSLIDKQENCVNIDDISKEKLISIVDRVWNEESENTAICLKEQVYNMFEQIVKECM
ncbi:polysaccharide pyruvyl transferase family protein [Butyrivibrio sp. AE3004]|uniref:polysaccharide pyruvyl transferase family protein n=1 Tax=Butyrivibrio sp. AE3004 TaxID=1506994 RepID=UPI0004940620|nr:polysaccharide pyruvyl transferase family protein [Butyrivibrio sp. AE3004]